MLSNQISTENQNTFVKRSGERVVVERFMQGPELSKGCHWYRVSDEEKLWVETPDQQIEDGSKLFGYEKNVFMQKQYKNKH